MDRAERLLRSFVSGLRKRPERYRVVGLDDISEMVGGLLAASEVVTESDLDAVLPGERPAAVPPEKAR